MGRPRKYQTAAEKQAAYRARLARQTALLDRRGWGQIMRNRDRLHQAVRDAADRGFDFAMQSRAGCGETTMEKLTRAFEG